MDSTILIMWSGLEVVEDTGRHHLFSSKALHPMELGVPVYQGVRWLK
jgi:hypothetical protein